MVIFIWKVIVWDKVLGWGSTDPLTGDVSTWAGIIGCLTPTPASQGEGILLPTCHYLLDHKFAENAIARFVEMNPIERAVDDARLGRSPQCGTSIQKRYPVAKGSLPREVAHEITSLRDLGRGCIEPLTSGRAGRHLVRCKAID